MGRARPFDAFSTVLLGNSLIHDIPVSAKELTLHMLLKPVYYERTRPPITLVAFALVLSCVARISAAIICNMHDKQVLVFHEEGFRLHAPFQMWEMMENANTPHFNYINPA